MKINYIRIIIYGAIFFGAFIAFFAGMFPVLYDYATAFISIGSAIVGCGVLFSIVCLRYQSCSNCQKYLNFRELPVQNCPHCGEKSQKYKQMAVK
jgi:Zn finger protein HypA/HybF involved in hydrogenase expression